MIQNNFINIFLDIVGKESPLKQKYLDMEFNKDNLNNSQSLMEHQFNRQSSSELYFQQLIQNNDTEQFVGQQQKDLEEQQLHQNLRVFQKQNIIKNILKSFLRYLKKLNDASIKQKYQSLYNSQFLISYSEIKKSLSRKINQKTTRWNFKLKSIVQSKNIQPIFYDYLKNQSKIWLHKSKRVSNLIEHELLINELLIQIEKELPLKIRIYKKKN